MLLISDKTRNVELRNVSSITRENILKEGLVEKELFYGDQTMIVTIKLDIRNKKEVERALDFFDKYKSQLPAFVERLAGEFVYGL